MQQGQRGRLLQDRPGHGCYVRDSEAAIEEVCRRPRWIFTQLEDRPKQHLL